MRPLLSLCFCAGIVCAQQSGPSTLGQVKRIYVEPLDGGTAGKGFRDLIIAGLNSTRLFVLTDNPDRADAVLKGSAEDHDFEDTLDTSSNVSTHAAGAKYSGSKSALSLGGGASANSGASESESHHVRERKHEAYASVRLCNRDGDVLWSTTQESNGAKFRSASSDVAAKVARQLQLDLEREQAAPTGTVK